MPEAAVIGGGIVGAATGYHLAERGVDVTVLDRDDPGQATAAGAGVVSPASSRHADPDWYELALAAADYYPDLVETLGGPAATGYRTVGALVVAVDEAEVSDFEAARERVFERQARYGYPPEESLSELSPAEAADRFPPLADVEAAYGYEAGARVDGGRITEALLDAGEAAGLERQQADVRRLRLDGDSVVGLETVDGRVVDTSAVVIAGGAWSARFADALGIDVPVEPQRGQLAHLQVDRGRAADWPVVSAFHGHYLVPWGDRRVVAGATRETGSGFDPRVTVHGAREVLAEALRLAPGLADAEVETFRVGLRPLSADGLPIIGPVEGIDGVYLATGHGPTGLTLGPYTGKLVAQLVLDGAAEHDLAPFDPLRF